MYTITPQILSCVPYLYTTQQLQVILPILKGGKEENYINIIVVYDILLPYQTNNIKVAQSV